MKRTPLPLTITLLLALLAPSPPAHSADAAGGIASLSERRRRDLRQRGIGFNAQASIALSGEARGVLFLFGGRCGVGRPRQTTTGQQPLQFFADFPGVHNRFRNILVTARRQGFGSVPYHGVGRDRDNR